jgi:hypothetical protein
MFNFQCQFDVLLASYRYLSWSFICNIMCMMKFVLGIILINILGNYASAQSLFKPEVGDNEAHSFQGTHILYINHASALWDSNKTSSDAIKELLSIVKSSGKFQTFAAVHSPSTTYLPAAKDYFVQPEDVDHTVLSSTGAHRLSFSEAKVIAFGGGNLSMCLCEAMRDIIRNDVQTVPAKIVLVKETIFDDSLYPNKYRQSSPLQSWNSFNLAEILSVMDDYSITEYFKNDIIGNNQFCPHQKMGVVGPLKVSDFNIILKEGNRVIGKFGNGPRTISIQLSTISNFLSEIDELDHEIAINQDQRGNDKATVPVEGMSSSSKTISQ